MLDRYIDRPHLTFSSGKYSLVDCFCYSEFLSHYVLLPKKLDLEGNYCQPPDILQDGVPEENYNSCRYPLTIPLISSKEKLKCRKTKLVLTYHSLIKIKVQKNMRNICYLCSIHSERSLIYTQMIVLLTWENVEILL